MAPPPRPLVSRRSTTLPPLISSPGGRRTSKTREPPQQTSPCTATASMAARIAPFSALLPTAAAWIETVDSTSSHTSASAGEVAAPVCSTEARSSCGSLPAATSAPMGRARSLPSFDQRCDPPTWKADCTGRASNAALTSRPVPAEERTWRSMLCTPGVVGSSCDRKAASEAMPCSMARDCGPAEAGGSWGAGTATEARRLALLGSSVSDLPPLLLLPGRGGQAAVPSPSHGASKLQTSALLEIGTHRPRLGSSGSAQKAHTGANIPQRRQSVLATSQMPREACEERSSQTSSVRGSDSSAPQAEQCPAAMRCSWSISSSWAPTQEVPVARASGTQAPAC
mmetsp:Transcript_38203/g.107955  ORF Transcript_38203/g.107955 Transcript_38203/m.107955 type:complete len:340 (+) Transcript_38203:1878-2897(+)